MTTQHGTQKNRRKPYLTDNVELGREFRRRFIHGSRRLIEQGKLRLPSELAGLLQEEQREAWLKQLEATDWNVFVEGPPHGRSKPEHVLKYLARYISGGPIGDGRLISCENQQVTFWARSKDKKSGNPSRPFGLSGTRFVQRWSLHILPKGYTRSRSYGGFHGAKRADYLACCRQLLKITDSEDADETRPEEKELAESRLPRCDRCNVEMTCIASTPRPSWQEIFTGSIYRERLYCPLLHFSFHRPNGHAIGGYG